MLITYVKSHSTALFFIVIGNGHVNRIVNSALGLWYIKYENAFAVRTKASGPRFAN